MKDGELVPAENIDPPNLSQDFAGAIKAGAVRKNTCVVCTISDDRGEQPTYSSVSISEIMSEHTIGDVISMQELGCPFRE